MNISIILCKIIQVKTYPLCEEQQIRLPIEIKEDINNPIRTFTKELKNGEKIVMDGANIVAEHYLVKIGRNLEN